MFSGSLRCRYSLPDQILLKTDYQVHTEYMTFFSCQNFENISQEKMNHKAFLKRIGTMQWGSKGQNIGGYTNATFLALVFRKHTKSQDKPGPSHHLTGRVDMWNFWVTTGKPTIGILVAFICCMLSCDVDIKYTSTPHIGWLAPFQGSFMDSVPFRLSKSWREYARNDGLHDVLVVWYVSYNVALFVLGLDECNIARWLFYLGVYYAGENTSFINGER